MFYISLVCLLQLVNQYWFIVVTEAIIHSDFLSFHLMSSSCLRILSKIHITFGCCVSVGTSQLWRSLKSYLVFDGSSSSEDTSRGLCTVLLSGLRALGGRLRRWCATLITSGVETINAAQSLSVGTVTTWLRWHLSGFSTVKLLSPPSLNLGV